MAAVTFDTLKFANTLKEAGVPAMQAEAEAKALSEVLDVNFKELATKEDLKQMEERLNARFDAKIADTKTALADTKAELIRWVVGVGILQMTLIAALLLRLAPG